MNENKTVAVKNLRTGDVFRTFRFDRRTRITRYSQWWEVARVSIVPGVAVIVTDTEGGDTVLPGLTDVEVRNA